MAGRVSSEANKALMRRFYEAFWCNDNAVAVLGFDAPRVAAAAIQQVDQRPLAATNPPRAA